MNEATWTTSHSAPGEGAWGHWLLRLPLAGVFVYMGIDKFMGGGISEFAGAMELPEFLSVLVALGEIGAGALIVLGGLMRNETGHWATRLSALGMIAILLGAIFIAHWGQWHFMATPTHPMGGMMFQVTMLGMALYLLLKGNRA